MTSPFALAGIGFDMSQILNFPEVMDFQNRWQAAKAAPTFLINWLQSQVLGELSAIASMESLRATVASSANSQRGVAVIDRVLKDENGHVHMFGELLRARGEEPQTIDQAPILEHMDVSVLGCALASRAEACRMGQIHVVMNDADVPDDVKTVLKRVAAEESFHLKAFASLAGVDGPGQLEAALARGVKSEW